VFIFTLAAGGALTAQVTEVDIGAPPSEDGHNLQGWGPIEPKTSGGNYGGVKDCRAIYAPEEYVEGQPSAGERWATLDLQLTTQGAHDLVLRHLDGLALNDAFDVYIYPVGQPEAAELIWTYEGDGLTVENWITSHVSVTASGANTLRLVSTAEQWSGWPKFGQVCFDIISIQCQPLAAEKNTWGGIKSLYR
jgi:hypothetical protein